MKLELLPKNLIIIINKMLENDNLVKMINDTSTTPLLSSLPVDRKSLFLTRVFPTPASPDLEEEQSQVRVWYPDCQFKNGSIIEDTLIYFDVVVHEKLILMEDINTDTTLRYDELAKEIAAQFDGKSIGTVGKLVFTRRVHLVLNKDFQMVRLIAKMMTIS